MLTSWLLWLVASTLPPGYLQRPPAELVERQYAPLVFVLLGPAVPVGPRPARNAPAYVDLKPVHTVCKFAECVYSHDHRPADKNQWIAQDNSLTFFVHSDCAAGQTVPKNVGAYSGTSPDGGQGDYHRRCR